MKSLRIKFPEAESKVLVEAVAKFNASSAYLDDVKIKEYQDHQVALIPIAEAS